MCFCSLLASFWRLARFTLYCLPASVRSPACFHVCLLPSWLLARFRVFACLLPSWLLARFIHPLLRSLRYCSLTGTLVGPPTKSRAVFGVLLPVTLRALLPVALASSFTGCSYEFLTGDSIISYTQTGRQQSVLTYKVEPRTITVVLGSSWEKSWHHSLRPPMHLVWAWRAALALACFGSWNQSGAVGSGAPLAQACSWSSPLWADGPGSVSA